jgi:hypothetical protein
LEDLLFGGIAMFTRLFTAFLISLFTCGIASAQHSPTHLRQPTITPQNSGTTNGLIAVSPVNPQIVWASGRNGTFTITTDGGRTWNASVVPGAEALQFRDVQAFNASVAYLMSIGANPTDFRIYKTEDGGATGRYNLRIKIRTPSTMALRFGRRTGESHTAIR